MLCHIPRAQHGPPRGAPPAGAQQGRAACWACSAAGVLLVLWGLTPLCQDTGRVFRFSFLGGGMKENTQAWFSGTRSWHGEAVRVCQLALRALISVRQMGHAGGQDPGVPSVGAWRGLVEGRGHGRRLRGEGTPAGFQG